jgi:hypothetical protein
MPATPVKGPARTRHAFVVSWRSGYLHPLTGLSIARQFTCRGVSHTPCDFYLGNPLFSAGNYSFAVNYDDRAVTNTNQANGHSVMILASRMCASSGYDHWEKNMVEPVGDRYMQSDLQTRSTGVSFPSGTSPRTMAKNEGVATIAAAVSGD